MSEKEVMSWVDLGAGSRDLAQAVADDGYRPDLILGIARGGLLIAVYPSAADALLADLQAHGVPAAAVIVEFTPQAGRIDVS